MRQDKKSPDVEVGILSGKALAFELSGYFLATATYCKGVVVWQRYVKGAQQVEYRDGGLVWDGRTLETLRFDPLEEEAQPFFELRDVVVGKRFHWEHKENQRFRGSLKFIVEEDGLAAVNEVDMEEYLASVISSEMNAAAPPEFLKAQAVVARSWLQCMKQEPRTQAAPVEVRTEGERLRWYDCRTHTRFDVCADDHCQRYQGITRPISDAARRAVAETAGEVLTYFGRVCDARFSKCCGGATEEFRYCWDDLPHPYLASRPDPYCGRAKGDILSRILTAGDRQTTDFLHWQVAYGQEELAALVAERAGMDFGQIANLVPVARGASGRIWKLKIAGTRASLVIGKELEIRRVLSHSHLYSSNFTVEKQEISPEGIPGRFVLHGLGWGHGVGLCQIGAAVMADEGFTYKEILNQYYPGTHVETL